MFPCNRLIVHDGQLNCWDERQFLAKTKRTYPANEMVYPDSESFIFTLRRIKVPIEGKAPVNGDCEELDF